MVFLLLLAMCYQGSDQILPSSRRPQGSQTNLDILEEPEDSIVLQDEEEEVDKQWLLNVRVFSHTTARLYACLLV